MTTVVRLEGGPCHGERATVRTPGARLVVRVLHPDLRVLTIGEAWYVPSKTGGPPPREPRYLHLRTVYL